MSTRVLVAALAMFVGSSLALTGQPPAGKVPATLDTAAIQQALGRAGQSMGAVYRVGFPRTDLKVAVGDVTLRPGFALGGWAAFMAARGGAVTHGDLVLTESEVNPVISALQEHGLEITAVHNHLLHEMPHVMYVHFWGQGDARALAGGLRAALDRTALPPAASGGTSVQPAPGFDADLVQKVLGLKGAVNGGVLSMSRPRPERVTMMGVELPPSFGMATAINVQDAGGGKVAATGDFVLLADEVNPVARELRAHGIDVTALHNHMMHGSPELYFMHFWALDTAERAATGLRAAIDAMGRKPGAMMK